MQKNNMYFSASFWIFALACLSLDILIIRISDIKNILKYNIILTMLIFQLAVTFISKFERQGPAM